MWSLEAHLHTSKQFRYSLTYSQIELYNGEKGSNLRRIRLIFYISSKFDQIG